MSSRQKVAPRSARNKMMDLLARRDHSEKELRKKLKEREFSAEEIDRAIQYGRDHNWLPDTEESQQKLAEKMAHGLHQRKKGIQYINHYLKQKGLPPLRPDLEMELVKATALLKNKNSTDKPKMVRFLASRGFTMETIRKALK